MHFDPESNLLSIPVARGTIDHVIEVGNVLIHVNKRKKPLLIEILDASPLMGQFEKSEIVRMFSAFSPAKPSDV